MQGMKSVHRFLVTTVDKVAEYPSNFILKWVSYLMLCVSARCLCSSCTQGTPRTVWDPYLYSSSVLQTTGIFSPENGLMATNLKRL